MKTAALACAVLFATVPCAAGQEPPLVEPGSVVTVVVEPPRAIAATRDSLDDLAVAYAIEPAGRVRLVGRRAGRFTWTKNEAPRLPVTFRVPDRTEAGVREVAIVAFEATDGTAGSAVVRVEVRAIRRLDVQLVAGREAAARGEPVSFSYTLINLGNAGDSVALSLETNLGGPRGTTPAAVWLAPFEERTGNFELVVPADAEVGSELYARLSATQASRSVSANAIVPVIPERGLFPDLVQIPSTVFVGSTVTASNGSPQTEPVAAVTGGGRLGRGTELLYGARYTPRGGSVYAFRGLLSGPRVFVGLRRPRWNAAAGDLSIRTSDLLGFQLQGRGLTAAWQPGPLSVQGLAARPTGVDGRVLDGHVAAAELAFGSNLLRAGVLGTHTERADRAGLPESSVRAAVGRLQVARGSHWLAIDAGPMRVSNERTAEVESGPAVEARYALQRERTELDLRFRQLPDLLADPRLPPSELRFTGAVRPARPLSVTGTLFDEAAPRALGFEGTRARGVRAGLRWEEPRWAVGLTGSVRGVRGEVDETRRLGKVDATLRSGDFTFDASLGLGTTRKGDETELARFFRIGGSWLNEDAMVTLHATMSDDILQPATTLLDAYGLYRLSEVVELYASANTFVVLESEGFAPVSISDGLTVQTGARLELSPNRTLYAGIERFSGGGSGLARWRLSVGIQQGIPLPLPLRRPPAASGTVFEDFNGNGRRDDGEPGLDGVLLRMGFETTVSLADGRFEFQDAEPRAIEVDPRSLGDAYVPIPAVRVPPEGEVPIGLFRSAGLVVRLFFDADADGTWDGSELPAAAIRVTVLRDGEPWVLTSGADGAVSLSSLAPGTYVIRVDSESLPSRALPAEVRSTELRGGETTEVLIPVPMRQVRFSRFGDAGAGCDPDTSACDDD